MNILKHEAHTHVCRQGSSARDNGYAWQTAHNCSQECSDISYEVGFPVAI